VFRGEGGKSFVSGTDINQLGEIANGAGGLAYEVRIDAWIGRLEKLPQPTIALVDGWALGAGLALAAACDFRPTTADAKFGAPIARTIGNCYSPQYEAAPCGIRGAARKTHPDAGRDDRSEEARAAGSSST